MSVMAETSQLAIRPYVAIAAVGLESYAWTAVCREVLVVKVYAGEGLGGEGLGGGGDGASGGGEGSPQQASLHFAESFFFFSWHKFVHLLLVSSRHAFSTFLLSFPLHVFLSVSASQFFGDGVGAVPLRPFATNDSGRTESNETEDGGA